MDKSKTSTGLLAPEVFIEDMLARGFKFDDSKSEEGVLEHPDVPGEAFKFPKNRKIRVNAWVSIKLFLDSGPRVFVLSHPDRKASVVLPGGDTELPDVVIRNVLRDEPAALQLMDAVDHHMEKPPLKKVLQIRPRCCT